MIRRFFPLWIALLLLGACKLPASQAPRDYTTPRNAPISPTAVGVGATQTALLAQGSAQESLPSPTPKAAPSPAATTSWCPLPETPASVPKGKLRIAYTSSRDAWLWEDSQEPLRLTQSGNVENPLLSDDGLLLAFTRRPGKGQAEIWVMDLGSRKERLLVNARQFAELRAGIAGQEVNLIAVTPADMQWVPGLHWLAFNTYPVLKNPGLWIYVPEDLWLVDADNGEITPSLPMGEGGQAVFSPDGFRAAILRLRGMDIIDMRGGGRQKDVLKGYAAIAEGESYFYPWPVWMPDSSALLLALPDTTDLYAPQASVTVWRIPVAGGSPQSLGTLPAFAPSISFSPDRLSVAFWSGSRPGTNERELSIARFSGLEKYLAAEGKLLEFSGWSPDSVKYIYTQPAPPSVFIGQLCKPPAALPGFQALPLALRWVDESRFLSIVPTHGPYELRLTGLEGSITLAQLWGESVEYDFALEMELPVEDVVHLLLSHVEHGVVRGEWLAGHPFR